MNTFEGAIKLMKVSNKNFFAFMSIKFGVKRLKINSIFYAKQVTHTQLRTAQFVQIKVISEKNAFGNIKIMY